MLHVWRPHFFIGLLLGNRLTTLAVTRDLGSTLGGLEFMRGRFGSSLVTLLLTRRFASVLFLLLATIGVSVKTFLGIHPGLLLASVCEGFPWRLRKGVRIFWVGSAGPCCPCFWMWLALPLCGWMGIGWWFVIVRRLCILSRLISCFVMAAIGP